jgi:hypothetical protein
LDHQHGYEESGDRCRQVCRQGVADGESYSEHLNPDGTISGHSPSGAYAGRWRISGDQICFSYPEGKRDAKWDCTEVKLKGSRIIWDDNTTAKLSEKRR